MSSLHASLENYLKDLRLPTMRRCFQELAQKAEADSIPYEHYLLNLAEREYENRRNNTIQRHLKESQLPLEKSLSTLDLKLLPVKIRQQFNALLDGSFLKRRENVLIFGGPGRGKTHILCALAQELVHQSYRVYFTPCTLLVQRLLIFRCPDH